MRSLGVGNELAVLSIWMCCAVTRAEYQDLGENTNISLWSSRLDVSLLTLTPRRDSSDLI